MGYWGMSFHGLDALQRRTKSPEKQTPPPHLHPMLCEDFSRVAGRLSLALQLLCVCAGRVLVHGEARLWDLVGSGLAMWLASAGHKDTNASG